MLVIANTLFQQHKGWLYTWTSPDNHYWNQIDYIICSWRWRSSIQSIKTRPRADCSSDYDLLNPKFWLKWKKVGKTIRPLRCDINKSLMNTVELSNRFKGLDLVDRVLEQIWMEVHNILQEAVTKAIPKKKKWRRQNGCLRRLYKELRKEGKWKAREKEKGMPN